MNLNLTKLMNTLGCPKCSSPPSQATIRSLHSIIGVSSIKSIAQFLLTILAAFVKRTLR